MEKRIKYWSLDKKVWVEEYKFLWLFKIYKETLFQKKTKWSFKKCKKPLSKIIDSTIYISKEDAIKRWGKNKWEWPLNPYKVL